MKDTLKDFRLFADFVLSRLEAGREEYGDQSFGTPMNMTLEEIEEECLDICGWGYILWLKVYRMRRALEGEEP